MKFLPWFVVIMVLWGCSRYYTFDRYYDEENWTKAYEIFQTLPKEEHEAYRIRLYRITLQLALQGDTQALSNLANLVQTQENRLPGYQEFGRLYLGFLQAFSSGDYEWVVSNAEPLSRFPSEFQAVAAQLVGIAYLAKNEPEQAKTYLQKSYVARPLLDTLYFLGLANLMGGNESDAVANWKHILSARPGGLVEAMSYFQLGEIEYNKGEFSRALELYYAAVNLYPDSEIFVDKIAFCYQKLKNKKLSEKFRKIALRINKDYATAWFYLNFN
ncbi:MAG: tetratricopeptide repeat protein [Brevinematales bacterium]|nr:tetratricopeptide repeat protein [Brevinematales bacterium]